MNAPSSFHDSVIADYSLYEKLEYIHNSYGAKIVVDSTFNIGNGPYLIKSSQVNPPLILKN